MKRLTLSLILFTLPACANSKAIATGIVASSDVAADTLADSWDRGTTARIEECRALGLPTEEERASCLGLFHPDETDKVIAAVQALVTVQIAIKEAAECEALSTCAQSVDWKTLAAQAQEAWSALKPYVQAVKEQDQ
jgi:hypothetical protein